MRVYLQQFKREEVDIDDNRTAGESQTEDAVDPEPEAYFGEELDLEGATWETVEYDGDPLQRRELEFDGVTAVSVPGEPDGGDDGLPGRRVQIRKAGGVETVENARVVEAEDVEPS